MAEINRRQFNLVVATVAACACLGETAMTHAEPPAMGAIDAGEMSGFDKDGLFDAHAKSDKIMIVRENDRVFAASSICTHKGCVLRVKDGEMVCPCHHSRFSIDGIPQSGPARGSLSRYAVSVNEQGHLMVDKSQEFTEKHWDDPASFVKVAK